MVSRRFEGVVSERMQVALRLVETWCSKEGLNINSSKTTMVPFTCRRKLLKLRCPSIFSSNVLASTEAKYRALSHSLFGHHSYVTMKHSWVFALLVIISLCRVSESRSLTKRQIKVEANIEPGHGEQHEELWRDKKKVEAKFGVKNALLGFVFNKINSFIDQKTHWVDQLDRTNIAKNKAHGIYSPKDPVISLTGLITETVGQKLQAAGPLIGFAVQKLTSSSGGLSGGSTHASAPAAPAAEHSAGAGFGFGNILGSLNAFKGFGSGGGHVTASGYPKSIASSSSSQYVTTTKRPTTTEDIVLFQKYEPVSADVPSEFFGSGFTLITNISKRIGDFMLDSAFRAHRVLESMRPFLWKVFGKKGIVIEAIDLQQSEPFITSFTGALHAI
ncbi:hypothetical protein Trydic_g9860 [Trypoxylus dichotomus]